MFDSLSERLQGIVKKTSGQSSLTDENMQDALREVRRALLEADVSLKVVKAFISSIKDKAQGEDVLKSLNPGQQLIKIVHEELKALLGGENIPISTEGNPNLIMLLGLQGSGKTTTAGKLALKLRKDGRKPLLVAADVYRPAAIKQLQSLGKQVGIQVFTIEGSQDVRQIVQSAIDYAKENEYNSVIIDTAGRLQVDTALMAELVIIDRLFEPAEKLLVIDSMIGQEAVHVAQSFDEQIGVTGIVLTKLDGDARGGAALSISHITGKPIKFAGMGEKLDALEPFYPDRLAQRILGMGDVLSLIEKAQANFDIDEAKELEKKMRKNEFSLEDFMKIQKQMKMMGSLGDILGMLPIPGLSKDDRENISHAGEGQLKKIEACISSMTSYERQNPQKIDHSRKQRIANGCGQQLQDINAFLKQFEMMKKMMKQMSGMTKQMRGKKGKKGKKGFGGMPNMNNIPPNMRNKFPKF